jgi:hypothetical protein
MNAILRTMGLIGQGLEAITYISLMILVLKLGIMVVLSIR